MTHKFTKLEVYMQEITCENCGAGVDDMVVLHDQPYLIDLNPTASDIIGIIDWDNIGKQNLKCKKCGNEKQYNYGDARPKWILRKRKTGRTLVIGDLGGVAPVPEFGLRVCNGGHDVKESE